MSDKDIARRDFMKTTAAAALGATVAGAAFRAAAADAPPYPRLPLGVLLGMLPKDLPDAEKFQVAKRAGFDGIEAYPMEDLDEAKRQGDAARAAGVPIHSLMYGGWDAPFSDPDEAVIARGLKNFEQALRSAHAMGADNVLLVPARVSPTVRYVEAYERSQANIRKLVPLAEELKVVIAIENVWNDFLLSPIEFNRYVDEFESPCVMAYFDIGNYVKFAYPQDWIRTLGPRINRIHLKDFTRKDNQFVPLREGDVDWPEVRKALAEIGFTGFCTAEVAGGDEAYLTELAKTMELCVTGQ